MRTCLVGVLIALGANGCTFAPSFPLGESTSRGRLSDYGKTRLFGQSAPAAPTDLSAQRVRAQVPATVLAPALLPGSGMPAASPALAGGAAAGQTSRGSHAKRRHAQAERERRQRAKSASRPLRTQSCAGAWSRSRNFFSLPFCDRPGCYQAPLSSIRNQARYCCPACRQAVRNVLDRERKWLSRGTVDGRKKRAIEYQAARQQRSQHQRDAAAEMPLTRPPPL